MNRRKFFSFFPGAAVGAVAGVTAANAGPHVSVDPETGHRVLHVDEVTNGRSAVRFNAFHGKPIVEILADRRHARGFSGLPQIR